MKRLIKIVLWISPLLFLTIGCGVGFGNSGPSSNQAAVNDLADLMKSHPELSGANLKNIKDSAQAFSHNPSLLTSAEPNHAGIRASNSRFNLRSNDEATESGSPIVSDDLGGYESQGSGPDSSSPPSGTETANPEEVPGAAVKLDAEVASKAQQLIDTILDKFDFQRDINAWLKLTGIEINYYKKMMKEMQEWAKEVEKAKGGGLSDKFSGDLASKEMSCEEIVNNPFAKMPKSMFEEAERINKARIKETLSGCPKLLGGKFVECMDNYNKIMTLINDYASCEMTGTNDLAKTIKEQTGEDFNQLDQSVGHCLIQEFANCGFSMKRVEQQTVATPANNSEQPVNNPPTN